VGSKTFIGRGRGIERGKAKAAGRQFVLNKGRRIKDNQDRARMCKEGE